MSVAIWVTPVVLAGLLVLLRVATWLERLVEPPGFDPEPSILEALDYGFTDTARPQRFSRWMARHGVNRPA